MPHRAAGTRTEPPVSVPMAAGAIPAETATADPPDDPPGDRLRSQGLRTTPNQGFSEEPPYANSSSPVRPMMIAPAASKRSTTGADTAASFR